MSDPEGILGDCPLARLRNRTSAIRADEGGVVNVFHRFAGSWYLREPAGRRYRSARVPALVNTSLLHIRFSTALLNFPEASSPVVKGTGENHSDHSGPIRDGCGTKQNIN